MKMKMKIGIHRHNIRRPRPGHEHKYNKYKTCLSFMMLICINNTETTSEA